MIIEMDLLATTAIGCAVALLGRFFINKVEVLKNWAIPGPYFLVYYLH